MQGPDGKSVTKMRRVFVRGIWPYLAVALASLAFLFWALKGWKGDIRIPIGYAAGDTFAVGLSFKGILDNGWYLVNPAVGAPHGTQLFDYPGADALNFFWAKVIGWFVPHWGAVLNLYFILTFPAIAATTLAVLRACGLRTATAAAMAMLYTFLPYHLWRGESHIFLGAYFLVPVIALLALRIWDGRPPFHGDGGWREALVLAILCLAIGSSGLYYAYFGCFFMVVAALSSYGTERNAKAIRSAVLMIALISGGVALNLAPTILYRQAHGPNVAAVVRHPDESEVWALKITQLLVPVDGHVIPQLASIKARYNTFPLSNENTAMLGLVGAIGFVALLLKRFRAGPASVDLAERLSILNLGAVILGTVGGLGGFLSLFAGTGIRSYNRISVFIAFFALCAVGLLIDRARAALGTTPGRVLAGRALVAFVLVFGLVDQVPPAFEPRYAQAKAAWDSDRAFVKAIEARLPAGSMVYQLPYVPFPENPPVHSLPDYDLFRGYLHSSTLRWSYGAMKGRPGDLWQRYLADKPLEQRIATAAAVGFKGVYVARRGYADGGSEVEGVLGHLIGERPLVSQDGSLSFFDLRRFAQRLRSTLAPGAWEALAGEAHPVLDSWIGGFHGREGTEAGHWRWSARSGTLALHNLSDQTRAVRLEMEVASGFESPSRLWIEGPGFKDELTISERPSPYARSFEVPPGQTLVKFHSDAPQVVAPADSRELVFRLVNPRVIVNGPLAAR